MGCGRILKFTPTEYLKNRCEYFQMYDLIAWLSSVPKNGTTCPSIVQEVLVLQREGQHHRLFFDPRRFLGRATLCKQPAAQRVRKACRKRRLLRATSERADRAVVDKTGPRSFIAAWLPASLASEDTGFSDQYWSFLHIIIMAVNMLA